MKGVSAPSIRLTSSRLMSSFTATGSSRWLTKFQELSPACSSWSGLPLISAAIREVASAVCCTAAKWFTALASAASAFLLAPRERFEDHQENAAPAADISVRANLPAAIQSIRCTVADRRAI